MIVYKATNLVNGKIYIGVTRKTLEERIYSHCMNSKRKRLLFGLALDKYGKENFKWDIIDTATTEKELNEKEVFYIDLYDATNREIGYNISKGGINPVLVGENNGMYGKTHTEEARRKMGLPSNGKTWEERFGEETAKKLHLTHGDNRRGDKNGMYGVHRFGTDNPFYGKHHSKEYSEKFSKRITGEGNPNYKDLSGITDLLVKEYSEGASLRELSRRYKYSTHRIAKELKLAGIEIRK